MAKLLKIDKNGTKYWAESKCPKCGGKGYIYGYEFIDGGRCWKCGGTGIYETTWKEYTPEYAQKLEERRIAKARKGAGEANEKFLKREGFSADGKAWVVIGDTYARREELKASGAKWNGLLGWHFNTETDGCFLVSIEEVAEKDYADRWQYGNYTEVVNLVKARQAEYAPKSNSKHIGAVGDKVEMRLTFKSEHSYETHYSYRGETHYIYKFADADGNIIIWNTSSWKDLQQDREYTVKGTIKSHSEYKGDAQTELQRCRISA